MPILNLLAFFMLIQKSKISKPIAKNGQYLTIIDFGMQTPISFVTTGIFCCLQLVPVAQVSYSDSLTFSKKILEIEQNLMNVLASGDTATWGKYLDPNFYIITEDGSGYNKKDFLATFTALPKGFAGHINVINPHFVFRQKTAVLHYVADEYESVFGQSLHTTYATMSTYYPTDTSWKMIACQVFEIPQLPHAIRVPNEILQKYTGVYHLTDTISCEISIENNNLFIQKKGRQKEELLPETNNVFFRKSDTRGRKIFAKDDHGRMLILERRNGQDVIWKRLESTKKETY